MVFIKERVIRVANDRVLRVESGAVILVQWRAKLKPPWQVRVGQEEPPVCDKIGVAFRHYLVAFLPVVSAGGDERAFEDLAERQQPMRDLPTTVDEE